MNNATKDTNLIYEKLQSRKYDPKKVVEDEQILFYIGEKKIMPIQSFCVLSGLPKAGKSTFTAAAIASAFTAESIFSMKISFSSKRDKIAYFDTESSEYDFYKTMAKIKQFSMLDNLPDRFHAFMLREDPPADLLDFIEAFLIKNTDCSVIVIDGFLDLLFDFNDVTESRKVINWLKRITKQYNCGVIGVLHLGKKDQHTLGHLGSACDRWANSTLKVEKDKDDIFKLTPSFMRSDSNFKPIELVCVNDRWGQIDGSETITNRGIANKMEEDNLINFCLNVPVDYLTLLHDLKERAALSLNKTKNILKRAIAEKVITKGSDGKYTFTKTRLPI